MACRSRLPDGTRCLPEADGTHRLPDGTLCEIAAWASPERSFSQQSQDNRPRGGCQSSGQTRRRAAVPFPEVVI